MACIISVNPAILAAAGIPRAPSMVATILAAFFGTMLMGVYAKRAFAIAPYMGENAFIACTVTEVLFTILTGCCTTQSQLLSLETAADLDTTGNSDWITLTDQERKETGKVSHSYRRSCSD